MLNSIRPSGGSMPPNRRLFRSVFLVCWFFCALHTVAEPLKWNAAAGFQWAQLPSLSSNANGSGFALLAPSRTGIRFTNTLDEWQGEANRVLFNGSGVALGDYDNDGLPDIYLCSLNGHNALYRNLGGWRFEDVTAASHIVCSNQFCRGAVFADLNGDRNLDLLVATTGEGVLCFLNQGNGAFTNSTTFAGTRTSFGSVTMALADVDGNGTLDLYVANNRTDDIRDRGQVDVQMVRGKLVIPPHLTNRLAMVNGRLFEFGEPDVFYHNDGKGHFTPVPWNFGAFLDENGNPLSGPPLDWGLTATFRDMNGDGAPDIYVCNDYWTPDRIWMNDGKGRFRAIAPLALRNTSASSMGIDFADLTRDGRMDFFVVDMLSRDPRLRKRQMLAQKPREATIGAIDDRPQIMRNTLAFNRGDGTYAEVAEFAGLAASEWSWSPIFLDVDLDGFEDLLITTGHVKDVQDLDASIEIQKHQPRLAGISDPQARHRAFIQQKIENARFYPHLSTPIVAFRNQGNLHFEEMTERWGTAQPGVHHAIATADMDGDGDLDLVVNNLGAPAGIYENVTSAPRVTVRLKGNSPNTQGIGSLVKLLGGAVPQQSQEIVSGGRYMAGSDPILTFAAGSSANGMTIEVHWRSGRVSTVRGVKPNCVYEIDESGAAAPPAISKTVQEPMFTDVSDRINHTHTETHFDDFFRQPMLPRKLSQLGPGVAWADLDGDGWDDLVIGSGKGGKLAAFRNNQRGGFERLKGAPWDAIVTRDQTSILFLRQNSSSALLVASANYEDGQTNGPAVLRYSLGNQHIENVVPATLSSAGPLALADMDANGTLDFFVGGRVIAGRYPEAASSYIYKNANGAFVLDSENSRVLERAGLVSGAVWSDLDQDGFPDLVLACEWGPIRVFRNRSGNLEDATAALGFSNFKGLWTSVNTADLDGDGRLDIIAGNWGLNTTYHASPEHPLHLFYGDFQQRGLLDLVETEFDPALNSDVPRRGRDALMRAIPDLAQRFPTHRAYSEAGVTAILGSAQARARELQVGTSSSTVFLNRGDHFTAIPLPREAQLAPVFSVNVADFNSDGREDLFLSQNFFATEAETPRADAGRGLLLLGDGKGSFDAIPAQESGLKIYGEQRGAAVSDFDRDGRVDLVVSQNGAATKLYRNEKSQAGLRVLIDAKSKSNPFAVGAILRLKTRSDFGPAREIHAGSGYLSQDSMVQVFPSPATDSELWVRWPGGKTNIIKVPAGSREIALVPEP